MQPGLLQRFQCIQAINSRFKPPGSLSPLVNHELIINLAVRKCVCHTTAYKISCIVVRHLAAQHDLTAVFVYVQCRLGKRLSVSDGQLVVDITDTGRVAGSSDYRIHLLLACYLALQQHIASVTNARCDRGAGRGTCDRPIHLIEQAGLCLWPVVVQTYEKYTQQPQQPDKHPQDSPARLLRRSVRCSHCRVCSHSKFFSRLHYCCH